MIVSVNSNLEDEPPARWSPEHDGKRLNDMAPYPNRHEETNLKFVKVWIRIPPGLPRLATSTAKSVVKR